ncbi:MAG: aldose 1-epimerase family protein, partial [Leuconostoc mesenteroides]
MITLENKHLIVKINPEGAELTSVWHKNAELEYIWTADPKY